MSHVGDAEEYELTLKVNINEKISKIFKYVAMGGGPGEGMITTNGQVIEKPDDKTFH